MRDGEIQCYKAATAPMYLVQQADSENFLIHREVSEAERQKLDAVQVIEHDGTHYQYGITNLPSLQVAESVIQSYFRAFNELARRSG